MFATLKRLLLGLFFIAGASALLLISDLDSRERPSERSRTAGGGGGQAKKKRVAILQHASQFILDEGRVGMIAGLGERGWVQGRNLEIKFYNAEGDMTVSQAIAKEMASGGYDLLLTITTVSLQSVANANRAGATPHVFGLVADPAATGVGIGRDPLDHPAHLAGYGTMQPVVLAFRTAREMNPALKTVGVVWNAAEANSEAQLKLARETCAELGITLLEATVDNSAGVGEAVGAVIARGAEAIWAAGDVTVSSAIDAAIAAAKKARIPVFSVTPPNVKRGALFDVGADYLEVGRLTGLLGGDILNGTSPASVEIRNVMPEMLTLNQQALANLKDTWTISEAQLARAHLVIDANGVEQAKRTAGREGAKPMAEAGRRYKIGFAYFSPEPSLEMCQRGVLDGLKEFGFVEGENLTIARTHAQGEMVNIPQMLQAMDATDVEAMVTFSTPLLQTALSMVKRKPVVFTYVTDPLAAGAGKSFEDHIAHVTGIGSLPPIDQTIDILRRTLPEVKTLGTIYNNAEANSVKIVSMLREETRRAGLELIELTAANSNEVLQAMQALTARRIDAYYMVSDNTAYLAFDAILKVADNAKIPVIVDDPDYLDKGAIFVCGPGFYQSGKAAAPMIARVLRGESPATIPMANVSVNTTKFNAAAIAKLGLQIPETLIREIEAAGNVTAAPMPAPRVNPNPSGKKWRISHVLFNETPPAEETLRGMKAAWARSPLVEGRDYEIRMRSAQGDMAALSGIIDAALTEGADIIVPLSTPTLQMAVQKVKRQPVVFTLVTNPMAVGAGRSYTDHLPNVTGIATLAPFQEALDLIEKHFPGYKRLGTVFCPAEANSVDLRDALEAECKRRGFVLESVAANTATDLPDAALSLVSRPIDAVLQISDNLSASGFSAIARAARQVQKPVISLNRSLVPLGAPIGFGRDYHNAGEATVALIERVIRGENPATMPFELPPQVAKAASRANARAVGMELSPELLAEMHEVVD